LIGISRAEREVGYNKRLLGDCLSKIQVSANSERGGIGAEACPVPEG